MSTKIYYAYRVPHRLFSTVFLPAFRKHIFMVAADAARKFMEDLSPLDLKTGWVAHRRQRETFKTWKKDPKNRLGVVFKKMAEDSKTKLRSPYCLDCSINVWLHNGWMYCILYGEPFLWRDFKPPQGVEDYCYWNNTGPSVGVTRRQWEAREKTWEEICLKDGGWDSTRMVHEVINASGQLGPGLIDVGRLILSEDEVWAATWMI